MKLHPRVTKTAVELVKRFEGLRRRAARLPDGGWTVGYGHTLSSREGAVVTPEEAELLLHYDLSEVAGKVEAWTFTPLNQNQFEALTAFAFNIGVDNFRRSTVLKRVNEGQHLQAAAAMELWRKSDVDGEGLVVDALVRRRAAEKAHYLTPPEGFRPSPSQVLRPAFDFSVIEAAAQSQVAQRAAVVDAPMEGDHAVASVEVAPEARPEPASITDFATRAASEHVTNRLQGVMLEGQPGALAVAERAPAPTVYAPEPQADPGVSGSTGAPPLVSRGFEPPRSRFTRAPDSPPAPANEHRSERDEARTAAPSDPFAPAEPSQISEAFMLSNGEEPGQAGHAPSPEPALGPIPEQRPEFNLFDRPLAPPSSTDMEIPTAQVRSARLRDDDETTFDSAYGARPSTIGNGHEPVAKNVFQDRRVLFASVGLLGVALFASAIFSMLTGKATWAHLLIGFLGVLFITPAGVYFLLSRLAGPAPAHE